MKSKERILFLGEETDPHLQYVKPHLDEDELLVVDTRRIIFGDHLTYWTGDRGSEVLYKGEPIGPVRSVWSREFSFGHARFAPMLTQEIENVGEAKLAALGFHEAFYGLMGDLNSQYWPEMIPVDPKLREYCRSGLDRQALALAFMFPEAFWISRREAVVRASHKPRQLQLAQECGFKVPETIITSDPAAARAFLERLGTCVAKPLSVRAPDGVNQPTRVLSADNPPEFEGLHLSPTIFQQLIVPAKELRITGMGSLTFTAEVGDADVASERARGVFDWREGFTKETFFARPYELPPSIREKHVELLRRAGLANGMTDGIIDENGEFFYLETNPSGAWGFVENATGFPMGRVQAELLRSGGHWNSVPRWAQQFA